MNLTVLALIVFSVSCSAVAQILLKIGMSLPSTSSALASGSFQNVMWAIIINPWVIGGLGLYFFGAVVWLFVLARVEVSYAYPFVALGFILTLFLGKVFMGDTVTLVRVLGTALVGLGVVLIARY